MEGLVIRKRGIALILVILVTTLLLLLLRAFLQLNRGDFAALRATSDAEKAYRAALSVYQYCKYRLEEDKTWGSALFPDNSVDSDTAPRMTVQTVKGTNKVIGQIADLQAEYEVELLNNINGSSPSDGVPPKAVRLRIRAVSGTAERNVEAMLRVAPVYDASALASGDIDVGVTSKWTVSSKDPFRNILRAKGDIKAPSPDLLEFTGQRGTYGTGSDQGIFWSKGDITFDGQPISDPTVARNAVAKTGGIFIDHNQADYDIMPLSLGKFRMPVKSASFDSGEYRFTKVTADYEQYEQVGTDENNNPIYDWVPHTTPPFLVMTHLKGSALKEYWYKVTDLPSGANIRNVTIPALRGATPKPQITDRFVLAEDNGVPPVPLLYASIGSKPGLYLDAAGILSVSGDFIVSADSDVDAVMKFSSTPGGITSLRISPGLGDLKGEQQGVLDVDGSIDIGVPAKGMGMLLARNGNIKIEASASNVSASTRIGLTLYAKGDIVLNGVRSKTGDTLEFHGLVYAGTSFTFNASGRNLLIEGALVARSGSIKVVGAQDVDFIYNPDYLNMLVKPYPGDHTRLERIVWRE